MKPKIIHKSSRGVETVGAAILVYGAMLTLAGAIIVFSSGHQAWPGLIVAGYGISSMLLGLVVKGASLIIRASETYLYNEEDHPAGSKDAIDNYVEPETGAVFDRNEMEKAENELKKADNAEPYRPGRDDRIR